MGHCKFLVANLGIVRFKTFLDCPALHAVIDSIDSLPVTFLHQLFMTAELVLLVRQLGNSFVF